VAGLTDDRCFSSINRWRSLIARRRRRSSSFSIAHVGETRRPPFRYRQSGTPQRSGAAATRSRSASAFGGTALIAQQPGKARGDAQAGLGINPEAAGHEFVCKTQVKCLDLGAVRAGWPASATSRHPARNLAHTRHSIVGRMGFRLPQARPGVFSSDIGSNCSVHPYCDDRIRRPASSSMSLTHAPCITSSCILRPACRMRRVISCIALTTSGWSGWPG
jgi:hypothetical protein